MFNRFNNFGNYSGDNRSYIDVLSLPTKAQKGHLNFKQFYRHIWVVEDEKLSMEDQLLSYAEQLLVFMDMLKDIAMSVVESRN